MSLLDEVGGSLDDWVDDPEQLLEDYIEDNGIDEEDIEDIDAAGGFYDSQIRSFRSPDGDGDVG